MHPSGSWRTTTGEIVDGPLLKAIRAHIGKYLLTNKPVAGFIANQSVKLCGVTDAGFQGLEITVEGYDANDQLIRRTLSIDDIYPPSTWPSTP